MCSMFSVLSYKQVIPSLLDTVYHYKGSMTRYDTSAQ